jgi:DNA invertase Pin-like site-specific DNA recombinase
VDSISAIRELKELGIDIYFEEQKVHTINATGELIITILSALAQEESRNISENVKWGIRKSFADGKVLIPYGKFLGYRKGKNGVPEIDEEEAKIVKLIYQMFWEGKSTKFIAAYLNEHQIPMPSKKTDENGNYIFKWQEHTVMNILSNEKYKGEAILQKTYTEDFLTHKKVKNSGRDIPLYHVKDSHPFIILVEEWEMVQVEMKRRGKRYSSLSVFGSKIICGDCGSCYGQKVWHSTDKHRKMIYRCNHKYDGKKQCKTPTITEEIIKNAFIESCRLMDKSCLIDDLKAGLEILENHKELDDKIMELVIECDALNESARKLIEDKKNGLIDFDEAEGRYKVLVKKHKEVSEELKKLEEQRSHKAASACRVRMHIKALEHNEIPIDEFQIKWWSLLLEKAVVYQDNRIEFIYYSGYKNEITIK